MSGCMHMWLQNNERALDVNHSAGRIHAHTLSRAVTRFTPPASVSLTVPFSAATRGRSWMDCGTHQ